jgi:hypothetical protein
MYLTFFLLWDTALSLSLSLSPGVLLPHSTTAILINIDTAEFKNREVLERSFFLKAQKKSSKLHLEGFSTWCRHSWWGWVVWSTGPSRVGSCTTWTDPCLDNRVHYFTVFPHCKKPIPKFRNKYSQKRNCTDTVLISTFMCLGCKWFIYSHHRSAYSAAGNMWTDPGNICINRSQTHECGNWDWCSAIPRKGIHKLDFPCSLAELELIFL